MTLKHKNAPKLVLNRIIVDEIVDEKHQKYPKLWICEKCNFECNKQIEYNRHLTTKKHLSEKKIVPNPNNKCDICEKEYSSYKSLWQHKKKCSLQPKPLENTFLPDTTPNPVVPVIDVSFIMSLIKDNQEFKTLLIESQKENKHMLENQNVLINKVIEQSHQSNTTNNTNCTNNNINANITNNNNNFCIKVFLNETCKDAINIGDFMKTIASKIELKDLEETGRLGYVGGITRIITNALNDLEVNKRPIHCTDIKRETVYIKSRDIWQKDNEDKDKLRSMVKYVADVNMYQLDDWKQQHPEWEDNTTVESKVLDKLYMVTLGAPGEEGERNMKKVIKNVLQEVVVDKET